MKVRMVITVTVDPDKVRAEYGDTKEDTPDRDIREFIKYDVVQAAEEVVFRGYQDAIMKVEVK